MLYAGVRLAEPLLLEKLYFHLLPATTELVIGFCGKSKKLTAFIDTGNMLRCPFTGIPVAVAAYYSVRELLPAPMIIGEIRRYPRDNTPVRVSRSLRDIAYKVLQVRDQMAHRLSREPTMEEIAKEISVNREEIILALDSIQEPVSLFEPIYNDGGDPIFVMDQIRDEKNQDENWLEILSIKDAIHKLNEREKLILTMRFYRGKTQMEVADEIGISQAQVSRLEKSVLGQLRKHIQ